MIRTLNLILIVSCSLPGCAAVDPRGLMSSDDARGDLTRLSASSDDGHADDAPVMVSLRRGELEFSILPLGSYVSVESEQGIKYQGTIVQRNQSRLELANCLRMSTVECDLGPDQLTTQVLPLHVVEKPTVISLTIMALPSPKFDPPGMKFEREDAEAVAVEFHSGRVQHWIEPQIEAAFRRDDHSLEEMVQAMKSVPAGSQISFTDLAGKRYNSVILSATPQKVNLRCCLSKEAISARDGHQADCLSVLPVCSLGIESISTFDVVASPPSDFDASEFDKGCELCLADVIYQSGRRQTQWKLARDDARMSRFFDKQARPLMEHKLATSGRLE